MLLRTSVLCRRRRWASFSARAASVRAAGARAALAVALTAGLAACGGEYPQSTLRPLGDFARMVDDVFMTTVWWALVVFVLVEGALLYAILRYRGKPDDPEPKQIHGNTLVEIVWTVIPALILAMIAVPTVRAIFKTYDVPTGDDALEVEVIGHQWWWEFRYPKYGLITANELHVPLNRPVALKMTTADVLHSFWVPQFAGKRDVFPKRNTVIWFRAEKEGNYSGQCAEFCGIQHGRMGFRVVAQDQATFDGYIEGLRATGAPAAQAAALEASLAAARDTTALRTERRSVTFTPQLSAQGDSAAQAPARDPLVAQGDSLFKAKGCIACHSLDATKVVGIGPNLANVGARSHIAAGWLANTDENLARWIMDPQSVKHGVLMLNLGVTREQATALVAYLRTRR